MDIKTKTQRATVVLSSVALLVLVSSLFVHVPQAQADNSPNWQQVVSPNAGPSDNPYNSYLQAVGGSGSKLFAVGYYNDINVSYKTLIESLDSQGKWNIVDSPNINPLYSSNYLNAVAVFKPRVVEPAIAVCLPDAWAVGENMTTGGGIGAPPSSMLVMYESCGSWHANTLLSLSGYGEQLNGIAVDDVSHTAWAVGQYYVGAEDRYKAVVMKWDGSSWAQVTASQINPSSTGSNYLTSVDVDASGGVWAAGYYTTNTSFGSRAFTLHWDGSTWTNANLVQGQFQAVAVSKVGQFQARALGYDPDYTEGVGYVFDAINMWRRDQPGTVLTNTQLLAASYTTNTLASFVVGNNDPGKAVHTSSTGVVGNYTKAYYNDGTTWYDTHSEVSDPAGADRITLIGVKAFSSNDAWAVGYYRDLTYQRWRTLIKHYTKLP